MPLFSIVPAEQAQRQPVSSQRALLLKEYQGYIEQAGSGRAGSLTPDAGETPQALRRRLGAAAKLSGVRLTIKRSGQTVYFWRTARRGRPRRSSTS